MPFFANRMISGLAALLFVATALYVAHQIGKMPDDPTLDHPRVMYENFAFVLALGLGVPWPGISSLFALLLIGWLGYRTGSWLSRLIGVTPHIRS